MEMEAISHLFGEHFLVKRLTNYMMKFFVRFPDKTQNVVEERRLELSFCSLSKQKFLVVLPQLVEDHLFSSFHPPHVLSLIVVS